MPVSLISSAGWNSSDLRRACVIYGFPILSLIDSALIAMATKKGMKGEPVFRGWLELHRKYGIWEVSLAKIVVSLILPWPELTPEPRVWLLVLYFMHVGVLFCRLLLKSRHK